MHWFFGDTPAQRHVTIFGLVLWSGWLAVGVAEAGGLVNLLDLDPFTLGGPDGFLPLQLLAYPFIHYGVVHLILDLAWLAGLVFIARYILSPAGFVRLYSL